MIAVKCPHCQSAIRCDDRYAGKAVSCPTCKKQIKMPSVVQPLPSKPNSPHSPPPRPSKPIAAKLPEPAPTNDDGLSFLSGNSSPVGSSGDSKPRSYIPKKKKKTDPTLYIVGGLVALIAVVGIGMFASGVFSPHPEATGRTSSKEEAATTSANIRPHASTAKGQVAKAKEEERKRQEEQAIQAEERRKQKEQELAEQMAKEQAHKAQQEKAREDVVNQRSQLLADLEKKKMGALGPLEAERDKCNATIDQLKKKFKDINGHAAQPAAQSAAKLRAEKTIEQLRAKIENLKSQSGDLVMESAAAHNKLMATIAQLEKRIAEIKRRTGIEEPSERDDRIIAQQEQLHKEIQKADAKLNAVEVQINDQKRDFWIAERDILRQYHLPDDPKYIDYLAVWYTESELQEVKQFVAEHGTAQAAAATYLEELKTKGVVEEFSSDGNPILSNSSRSGVCVPHQVRYVSRSGEVMQRRGWVTVEPKDVSQLGPLPSGAYLPGVVHRGVENGGTIGGTYWYVPRTEIAGSGEVWNLVFGDGPGDLNGRGHAGP